MAQAAHAPEGDFAPEVPSKNLPPMPYEDIPEPQSLRKVLGPSVILAALSVGSGELILWPYITSQVGFVLLWLAFVSLTLQYVINMEVERWTLATGETAIAGFVRLWKPWGILMALIAFLTIVWPGWATSGATVLGFLFGLSEGGATWLAIAAIVAIGITLTLSPVVYNTIEKLQAFKVVAVFFFLIVTLTTAISASAYGDLGGVITGIGTGLGATPGGLDAAVVLGAIAFAGAGGMANLCQANWVRDKGFGMGAHIPRIVSPVTGEDIAAPATGKMVRQDDENLRRFWGWWSVASKEQLISFWFITGLSILTLSLLAYSTVFGQQIAEEANLDFLEGMGMALMQAVGGWFGILFWIIGGAALLFTALGNVDYVSREIADVMKTVYLTANERVSESRLYFGVVWGMCLVGISILLSGFDQPLILIVVSASLSGVVMFVYSILLIQLNRRALPAAIKLGGARLVAMIVVVLFYGYFSARLVIAQAGALFGG